jgi:hypothetical protein
MGNGGINHRIVNLDTSLSASRQIVRADCSFNGLQNNTFHVSGFCDEDRCIVELNAVSRVDTVFGYGRLVPLTV